LIVNIDRQFQGVLASATAPLKRSIRISAVLTGDLDFWVPTPRCGEADTGRTTHDVTCGDGRRLA
jgi:hypothetical protein